MSKSNMSHPENINDLGIQHIPDGPQTGKPPKIFLIFFKKKTTKQCELDQHLRFNFLTNYLTNSTLLSGIYP